MGQCAFLGSEEMLFADSISVKCYPKLVSGVVPTAVDRYKMVENLSHPLRIYQNEESMKGSFLLQLLSYEQVPF